MAYIERVVDRRIDRALQSMGGVIIEGPRACGKTTTGLQHARSAVRLDESPELVTLATLDPKSLLVGDTPRLIDEWQLAPTLWNVIRHEIDDRQQQGQFILSGSATPPDDIRRHSGVGRIARVKMRTMSLAESGRSNASVSLSQLSRTEPLTGVRSELTYRDLASEAIRGGWPSLVDAPIANAMEFNESYFADLTSTELHTAVGVRHDPARVRRLLASLARNISSEATLEKLVSDVNADGSSIARNTIREYLDALGTVFAYEELPAWSASLRSRTRLRQQPKLQMVDPSLACAALGLTPQRLAQDPEYFGQVFESLVIRDLHAYMSADGGHLFHYRDSSNLEIDVVLEFPTGEWAAVEVKLGSSMVPAAEANLIKLRDERIDTERMGAPRFLAVVTGTEFGYTLPSGVHVVPVGTLTC